MENDTSDKPNVIETNNATLAEQDGMDSSTMIDDNNQPGASAESGDENRLNSEMAVDDDGSEGSPIVLRDPKERIVY